MAKPAQVAGRSNKAKSAKKGKEINSEVSQYNTSPPEDTNSSTPNLSPSSGKIELISIDELHLDANNPRFGIKASKLKSEVDVLDHIVKHFGVDDVLSSIAVNGYFQGEPLLVKPRKGGGYTVAEGNRRLTACLIITDDDRAANQEKRVAKYKKLHNDHGNQSLRSLPVVVFQSKAEQSQLLPYLGVKHISGSQQWDTYAKARWVANAVEQGTELEDIINMIGDSTDYARKVLQGYYVIEQLTKEGRFEPTQSHKKGTKSNTEYPFSWVYTILGYNSVRTWLNLSAEPKKDSLHGEYLKNAQQLITWMFGQEDAPPIINESREIGLLANAIEDPDQLRFLRMGSTLREVKRMSDPIDRQIIDSFTLAQDQLGNVVKLLAEGTIRPDDIDSILTTSIKVRNLAVKAHRELAKISGVEE